VAGTDLYLDPTGSNLAGDGSAAYRWQTIHHVSDDLARRPRPAGLALDIGADGLKTGFLNAYLAA